MDIEPVSAPGSSEPARGIKPLGDGEWLSRKHGIQGRRRWRKVYLAMDTATSHIRAEQFTPSSDGDSPVLPELLDQIDESEEIGTVTTEGAYDGHSGWQRALIGAGRAVRHDQTDGRKVDALQFGA